MMHTIYLYQCLLFQHPKMSEVLYMCVVFGVGTTYGKRRPLKGERERQECFFYLKKTKRVGWRG